MDPPSSDWDNSLSDGGSGEFEVPGTETESEGGFEEPPLEDEPPPPPPPRPVPAAPLRERLKSALDEARARQGSPQPRRRAAPPPKRRRNPVLDRPNPSDPALVRACVQLKEGHVHLVVGRTNSGKTRLIKDIIYANVGKFHRIYVLCPTAGKNSPSYTFMDPRYVYKGMDVTEDLLQGIVDEQKRSNGLQSLLVLDDCVPHIEGSSKVFAEISTQSRHMGGGLTTVLALQHLKSRYCPPMCRDNALVSFILRVGANNVKASMELQDKYEGARDWAKFLARSTIDHRVVRSDGNLRVFKLPPDTKRPFIAYPAPYLGG